MTNWTLSSGLTSLSLANSLTVPLTKPNTPRMHLLVSISQKFVSQPAYKLSTTFSATLFAMASKPQMIQSLTLCSLTPVNPICSNTLRRLKLHGQNLPKSASLRHSGEIGFIGDPKTQERKIKQISINWTIFIHFQEGRLPRKIIYLPKNALLFWENHDFLLLLPLMLSYENTHELSILSKTSF